MLAPLVFVRVDDDCPIRLLTALDAAMPVLVAVDTTADDALDWVDFDDPDVATVPGTK